MVQRWPSLKNDPLHSIIQFGMDLLYPRQCAGCGAEGEALCPACLAAFSTVDEPLRLCSGEAEGNPENSQSSLVVWSDAWYRPPASSAILYLKYRPERLLAEILAGRLMEVTAREALQADLVAVIPLGKHRRKQRGYNQVELLARPLSRLLQLPFSEEALIRARETMSQVGLDYDARRVNVSGAFSADSKIVQGKHVLLLDDVVTTGATILSAAGALLSAGARQVTGVTVARAASQSNW